MSSEKVNRGKLTVEMSQHTDVDKIQNQERGRKAVIENEMEKPEEIPTDRVKVQQKLIRKTFGFCCRRFRRQINHTQKHTQKKK